MRRAVSSLLALLTALALVLAAASSWTTRTALDTRSFVAQVGPVIDQQPVRDAIASDVGAQITALLHLPAAKGLVEREVRLFVGKPSFRPIWLAALASVHRQVVTAVTGPDVALQQVGGEIYLDLIDVVVQVVHDLPPVALSLLGASGSLHVPAGATGAQTRSLVSHFLAATCRPGSRPYRCCPRRICRWRRRP